MPASRTRSTSPATRRPCTVRIMHIGVLHLHVYASLHRECGAKVPPDQSLEAARRIKEQYCYVCSGASAGRSMQGCRTLRRAHTKLRHTCRFPWKLPLTPTPTPCCQPCVPRADPAREAEKAAADASKYARQYMGVSRAGTPFAVEVRPASQDASWGVVVVGVGVGWGGALRRPRQRADLRGPAVAREPHATPSPLPPPSPAPPAGASGAVPGARNLLQPAAVHPRRLG